MSDSQHMTWACPSCDANGNRPRHRPGCKRPQYPADINEHVVIGACAGNPLHFLAEYDPIAKTYKGKPISELTDPERLAMWHAASVAMMKAECPVDLEEFLCGVR